MSVICERVVSVVMGVVQQPKDCSPEAFLTAGMVERFWMAIEELDYVLCVRTQDIVLGINCERYVTFYTRRAANS